MNARVRRLSPLFCSRDCYFSYRGRCNALSREVWLREYEVSAHLWEMGLEREATIPRDCPIYHGEARPPWEELQEGRR